MKIGRRVLFFVILMLVFTGIRAGNAQTFPSLVGTWNGSFTNRQDGGLYSQTMIIEEVRGTGDLRGRYIGYLGNESHDHAIGS